MFIKGRSVVEDLVEDGSYIFSNCAHVFTNKFSALVGIHGRDDSDHVLAGSHELHHVLGGALLDRVEVALVGVCGAVLEHGSNGALEVAIGNSSEDVLAILHKLADVVEVTSEH